MKNLLKSRVFFAIAIMALCSVFALMGQPMHEHVAMGMMAIGSLEVIGKQLDGIEAKLAAFSEKAEGERKANGEISAETKKAIELFGNEQKALAERLLALEQKGVSMHQVDQGQDNWGQQFTKSAGYKTFIEGGSQKAQWEVKNTVTNAIGNTFSERKPGVVGGAFRTLTLEALLTTLPTTSSSVDYVRENVFTNAAAETTEGNLKAESSVTTTLVSEPVATVAHWIRISRQLAADNAALAAYINLRMRYGVDLRVENQIIAGNGTAPNMSGFTKSGNFTAHGYTAASLTARFGSGYTRLDMLRAIIADCMTSDYPADTIMLNPVDWATIETLKDSQGRYLIGNPNDGSAPRVWRTPVVESNAVAADTVLVASLANAATFHNREAATIALSESDGDNFQRNLITIRAERRCLLAVERPAAVRYGDLTPA